MARVEDLFARARVVEGGGPGMMLLPSRDVGRFRAKPRVLRTVGAGRKVIDMDPMGTLEMIRTALVVMSPLTACWLAGVCLTWSDKRKLAEAKARQ